MAARCELISSQANKIEQHRPETIVEKNPNTDYSRKVIALESLEFLEAELFNQGFLFLQRPKELPLFSYASSLSLYLLWKAKARGETPSAISFRVNLPLLISERKQELISLEDLKQTKTSHLRSPKHSIPAKDELAYLEKFEQALNQINHHHHNLYKRGLVLLIQHICTNASNLSNNNYKLVVELPISSSTFLRFLSKHDKPI